MLVAPPPGSFDGALKRAGERRLVNLMPLTGAASRAASRPQLNADGTEVAFEAIGEGLACAQIFVVDSDGYHLRLASSGRGRAQAPDFSPSGAHLIYHTSESACADRSSGSPSLMEDAELKIVDLTTGTKRALNVAPHAEGYARFSSRGDRIVYTAAVPKEDHAQLALYVAERNEEEGGLRAARRLEIDLYSPSFASFDPAGERLVFTASPSAEQPFVRELYLYALASGELKRLTEDEAQHGEPTFHPDGRRILFSSNLDASMSRPDRQIYMIDDRGLGFEQITFGPGLNTSPTLSARGSRIAFSSTRRAPGATGSQQPGETRIVIADFLDLPKPMARLRGQAAIEAETLKARIERLSDEAMAGREAGTPGEVMARDYLAEQFEIAGLQPWPGLSGSFIQSFEFTPPAMSEEEAQARADGSSKAPLIASANLVGWLPARQDARPTELVLLLGAHYDHLGRGHLALSSSPEHLGALHPGADDNASGVAAMLEVVEALAATEREHDVIVVAFGAEEYGLFGSAHFTRAGVIDAERILMMLNFDMVGRLDLNERLEVRGADSGSQLRDLVRRVHPLAELDVRLRGDITPLSDFYPFYSSEVPFLSLSTGKSPDYHSPEDTPERIDIEGLERVTMFGYLLASEIARSGRRPTFQSASAASTSASPVSTAHTAPGRQAMSGPYFGSMPGRPPEATEPGVFLRSIQQGSPAERAGLHAGDRLVRFGDRPIASVEDFAEALSAHAPGDRVEVVVARDGEELTIAVELTER